MDLRIQIRIHTKMSWICNTGYFLDLEQLPGGDGLPAPSPRLPPAPRSRLLHKLTFQTADRPLQICIASLKGTGTKRSIKNVNVN
jgi:hypothetical protein